MATHFLGPQFDIHGGGADLIFPHHSCEIAQTERATGVHPYVRYWMHVGIVKMAELKMSKTQGNLIIIHKLINKLLCQCYTSPTCQTSLPTGLGIHLS
jgi:L-cysteine:1D-myo-inositol 2-amino-2-deoxy-alpha-D-glucopyranoside ligase